MFSTRKKTDKKGAAKEENVIKEYSENIVTLNERLESLMDGYEYFDSENIKLGVGVDEILDCIISIYCTGFLVYMNPSYGGSSMFESIRSRFIRSFIKDVKGTLTTELYDKYAKVYGDLLPQLYPEMIKETTDKDNHRYWAIHLDRLQYGVKVWSCIMLPPPFLFCKIACMVYKTFRDTDLSSYYPCADIGESLWARVSFDGISGGEK